MIFVFCFLPAVQYHLAVSSVNFFFVFMSNPIVPFLRACIFRLDVTGRFNTSTLLASGLLILKRRIESKVIKKYDEAKTPYHRLMESPDVTDSEKEELWCRKNNLDLTVLLETTHALQRKLISMAQPWS